MIIGTRDSATDRINGIAKLSREVHGCQRLSGEFLKYYIERLSRPAEGYLKVAHEDRASAECQLCRCSLR